MFATASLLERDGSAAKPQEEPAPSEHAAQDAELDARKPLKRLRDLEWPEEPDSSLWSDPLRRDELKPLRNFELEAVGQSSLLIYLLQVIIMV